MCFSIMLETNFTNNNWIVLEYGELQNYEGQKLSAIRSLFNLKI